MKSTYNLYIIISSKQNLNNQINYCGMIFENIIISSDLNLYVCYFYFWEHYYVLCNLSIVVRFLSKLNKNPFS